MMTLFLLMMFWHFLADYPLQGDFLARAKNRTNPIPGTPWWQALVGHSYIHAAGVGIITGMVELAIAEFVAHAAIDDAKCRGKLTFNHDQALHVLCKGAWAFVAYAIGSMP